MSTSNINTVELDKDTDLSLLKFPEVVDNKGEIIQCETDSEQLDKKIVDVRFPKRRILSDLGETEFPVMLLLSDGTKKLALAAFDKYFRLRHKFRWEHPKYSEDADVITMEDSMKAAAPYNIFFNTLEHCPETDEQLYSINFADLLCPSFGKLKCSFHITFMADIKWILSQFAMRNLHKLPMTIIHGYLGFPWPEKETMERLYPNIDHHHIEVKRKETDLGCHHTKLSIFVYEDDSLRVVIGSANLYAEDWDIFNEQLWISPPCPKLPEGSSSMAGESPTGFKFSMLDYLLAYMEYDIPTLRDWIDRVKNADFSEVKVSLVYSVPGVHYPRKNGSLPHFLGHLLSRDCFIPAPKEEHDSWRIIGQTSALGLLGKSPEEWLTTHLLKALGSHKDSPYFPTLPSVSKIQFNLIFPTVQNSKDGYLGINSAACCPYDKDVKEMQPWLLKYKCQWKADRTKRTRAMSHSKCYCRISPCWKKMTYYFLTSANLSRSAWGKIPNRDTGIYVRSYEMGLLFLPKYFGEEYFEVKNSPTRKNKKLFPMMFDLPLTPYGPDDDSFCAGELASLVLNSKDKKPEDESEKDSIDKSEEETKPESSTDLKQNTELPSPSDKTKVVNKWDENPSKNIETTKKDMKYNVKPNANMFFPSFSKKS